MKKPSMKSLWKKTKRRTSNCMLMLRCVQQGDRWLIPLKLLAILFTTAATYFNAIYLKWIIDFIGEAIKGNAGDYLREFLWLVIVLQAIRLVFALVHNLLDNTIIPRREYRMKNELQNLFIRKAMKQDLSRYEDFKFYDSYTKTVRYADTKALEILNLVCQMIESLFSFFAILSLVAVLDAAVLILCAIMVIADIVFNHFCFQYNTEQYEAEETVNRTTEYIKKAAHHREYAKEVRTFQLSKFLIDKLNQTFLKRFAIYKRINFKNVRAQMIYNVFSFLLPTAALIIYCGYQVFNGNISLGSFIVLYSNAFNVTDYLTNVTLKLSQLAFEGDYYIEKLRRMLDYTGEIESKEDGMTLEHIDSIAFSHVSFHYPDHEQMVLEDVSFEIDGREHIALVGRNGAGKSTIIKLILRLYDVTDGEILINGVNIKDYSISSLRKAFSAVQQDFQLFDFTIRENLCLGQTVPEQKIKDALAFAGIEKRIERSAHGIDTSIGRSFDPEGESFSGGEMQKLAIARAQVRESSCYIWDEANSALDPFAEAALNQKILDENKDKMMIIVSHRLTTAVGATRIIHIEYGKLVGAGSHEVLMQEDECYREMFMCQAKAYQAHQDNLQYEK